MQTFRRSTTRWLHAVLLASSTLTAGAASAAPEVWFIRHAESDINVIRGPLPHADEGVSYPLTEKGITEAIALKAVVVGQPIRHLYSSTRLRTLQTADAIAFQTGLTLRLAPELVEVQFGPNPDFSRDAYPVFERWLSGDADARAEGGDSLTEVRARFAPFWDQFVTEHADDDGIIILVTHGAIIGLLLPELCPEARFDDPMQRFVRNTGIVKAELTEQGLSCREWDGQTLPAS